MCEQFNSQIVQYKGKPIITMAEEIRCYVMRKMNDNRYTMARYQGPICPRAQDRLEIAKKDSKLWTPQWVGDPEFQKFEVTHMGVLVKVQVDLGVATCSCRIW